MFQKGLSFTLFLCSVFVITVWDAPAQTPQELYARGMQAARQGKHQQALQNLQRAVALQPGVRQSTRCLRYTLPPTQRLFYL